MILQNLSSGINSYEELARKCNVTRNTVYRRIASLENQGIIKNTIRAAINIDRLDITPVCFGVNVPESEKDNAFHMISAHKKVRFLWRTYGDHNMMLVVFCAKGEEGLVIEEIKAILEECNVKRIHVSTGFAWEKMDLAPFDEQIEIEGRVPEAIESRN